LRVTPFYQRPLLLAAAALLLHALLGLLNHLIAPWQVQVWCGGLLVPLAALYLSHPAGATGVFLAGLLWDAPTPMPFGTQALLLLAAHAVVYHLRDRFPRAGLATPVVIALVVNLALFLQISFLRAELAPRPTSAWGRLLVDLFASQLVLALIGPWFFAVQARWLGFVSRQGQGAPANQF
jgi:rod shape-determining protein MreD